MDEVAAKKLRLVLQELMGAIETGRVTSWEATEFLGRGKPGSGKITIEWIRPPSLLAIAGRSDDDCEPGFPDWLT